MLLYLLLLLPWSAGPCEFYFAPDLRHKLLKHTTTERYHQLEKKP